MVLSVIETEEECKTAPSTLGGVHSLHYINPPKWSKPEAASTSTTASAVSTACRSPRIAGDSPGTSTFLELQAFFGSAGLSRVLTQDESSPHAPQAQSRSPPNRFAALAAITTPAASKSGHGSMRPRERAKRWGRQTPFSPLRGQTFSAPEGHLLGGRGMGTDCPIPCLKPSGRNAAGRSTPGGIAMRPPGVPRRPNPHTPGA